MEKMNSEIFHVNLALSSDNRLLVSCSEVKPNTSYAFILCQEDRVVNRLDFSPSTSAVFWIVQEGNYHVKAVAVQPDNTRLTAYSNTVVYQAAPIIIEKSAQTKNPLRSTVTVLTEIGQNWERMLRLSLYDYRSRDKDSYLGRIWSVLNPLIQVLTFWFVFGLGIRGGRPVDGHPFLLWMLCGLFPWFFCSSAIVTGNAAIYNKAGMVLRMRYPLATIPVGAILVAFFEHIVIILILLVFLLFYGYTPSPVWLNVIYYWGFGLVFFSALALVTSTLTMIARDFQKLINALIRLLFYMTPILWTIDSMPEYSRFLLSLNPILYLVNGYRDSLLYGVNFWEHMGNLLFFWCFAGGLLVLGCTLHDKYREHFNDFL
ncbi:ABC transporter permease [Oscillospiraceae bacterium 50-60]